MPRIKLTQILFLRYFWHLIIIFVVAFFSFGYFFLIKPKLDLMKPGGNLDVSAYKERLLQEKLYFKKIQYLIKEYEKLKQDKVLNVRLEKLSHILADKLDEPGLLYFFQIINNQEGIKPTNFVLESKDGISKIKISFSQKDYFGFKNYLKTLENSVRLIDVSNIQMSVREGNYTLELLTYYLE
jgi:hypothetical protein